MEDAPLRLELSVTERTGTNVRLGPANESGCNRNSVAQRTSRQALERQCESDGDGGRREGNYWQPAVRVTTGIRRGQVGSRLSCRGSRQLPDVILRSAAGAPKDRTTA